MQERKEKEGRHEIELLSANFLPPLKPLFFEKSPSLSQIAFFILFVPTYSTVLYNVYVEHTNYLASLLQIHTI